MQSSSRRWVGSDPVLLGAVAVMAAAVVWYATDSGGTGGQALVFAVYVVVASGGTALCAGRAASLLRRGDPARRFWRVFSVAGAIWSAGYLVEVVSVLPRVAEVVSPRPGTVAQAALALGTAALVVVMLTYPLGMKSRHDRLCVFLDIATVMTAVAVISVTTALSRVGAGSGATTTVAGTAAALAGPVVLMVCVFATVKLMLGGASPFTRWTAILGAAGAGSGGVAEAVAPLLIGTGQANWWHAAEVVTTGLVFLAARVHQVQLARRDPPVARRRRRYSVLPYVAIAGTYALQVNVLAKAGLDAVTWVVVVGAMCCTALVVARQVVAFVDNARLLAERDALAEELRRLAFYDNLTGLANRALFTDRLDGALAGARSRRSDVTVMLVDLDDFKPVNDVFGHAAGDAVLVEVGRRLRACVRETDTVARLGGDEFVVLLERASAEGVDLVAERIIASVAEPIDIGGQHVTISASIGVAEHQTSADRITLLRAADAAMYQAKRGGKGAYHLVAA